MKKKFYLKDGKVVNIGDEICIKEAKKSAFEEIKKVTILTVTEDSCEELVKRGIIFDKKQVTLFKSLDEVFEDIANRMNMAREELDKFMNTLLNMYPVAALNVILRTIALNFDKKYDGHISKCSSIYMVSSFDGSIITGKNENIANWGHFAAFRTLKDAQVACAICSPILKMMFNSDEK